MLPTEIEGSLGQEITSGYLDDLQVQASIISLYLVETWLLEDLRPRMFLIILFVKIRAVTWPFFSPDIFLIFLIFFFFSVFF